MERFLARIFAWMRRSFVSHPRRWAVMFAIGFLALRLVLSANAAYADTLTDGTEGIANFLAGVIATILTFIIAGISKIIVLLIEVAIVPLMQYNAYSTSAVIGTGWAVIRDTVNMFFVIILIIIAMGTIFGQSKYQWRQQIPRLMIMAIVINFSRLLCGLMIDFSQVIMLTFVNALKDIAGGNFVQMLGLNNMMSFSNSPSIAQSGIQAVDIFMGAMAAMFMMLAVLVAMLMLVIVLAYRIVMIWMLVVLAPLAWFFKGAEGVVATKGNPWAEWWKRWNCALQSGPILTFFLWLGLAVAGSGSLASDFKAPTDFDVGSMIQGLSTANFVSFLMGMVILFQGFDVAKGSCDSTEGIAKAIGSGSQRARAVVSAPALAATYAGRQGLAAGRAAGGLAYRETAGRAVTAAKGGVASGLANFADKDILKRMPGGDYVAAQLRKQSRILKTEDLAKADLTAKTYADESVDTKMDIVARGKDSLSVDSQSRALGVARDLIKDPDQMSQLSAEQQKVVYALVDSKSGAEPAWVKQKKALLKTSPHLDKDAVAKMKWSDVPNYSAATFKDQAVVDQMNKQEVEVWDKNKKENVKMTMGAAIDAGFAGAKAREQREAGLKALTEKNKEYNEQLLTSTRPEEIGKINVSGQTAKDLRPEVIVKIAEHGNATQLADIAKDADKRKAADAAMDAAKERLKGMPPRDEAARTTIRGNMAAMLGGDLAATARAYEISDGKFSTDDARSDFQAAVKKNPDLLKKVDLSKADSAVVGAAAAGLGADGMKKLIEKYQTASGAESKQYEQMLTNLVNTAETRTKAINAELATIPRIGSVTDAAKRNKLTTELKGLEGGVMADSETFKRVLQQKTVAAAGPVKIDMPPPPSAAAQAAALSTEQRAVFDQLTKTVDKFKRDLDQQLEAAGRARTETERNAANTQADYLKKKISDLQSRQGKMLNPDDTKNA